MYSVLSTNRPFLLDYACNNIGCQWEDYVKDQDWGYYSETEGDCHTCQASCDMDTNCGAVECGEGYCSWWKKGICNRQETTSSYYTCWKKGKY